METCGNACSVLACAPICVPSRKPNGALAACPKPGALPGVASGTVSTAGRRASAALSRTRHLIASWYWPEVAEAQRPTLRELWRARSPAVESSSYQPREPLAHSKLRPSSRTTLQRDIDRCWCNPCFSPNRGCRALHPPFGQRRSIRPEMPGATRHSLWPRLAGVHIVEARNPYMSGPVKGVRRARSHRARGVALAFVLLIMTFSEFIGRHRVRKVQRA